MDDLTHKLLGRWKQFSFDVEKLMGVTPQSRDVEQHIRLSRRKGQTRDKYCRDGWAQTMSQQFKTIPI
jgi:hypothetical protein